MKPVGSPVCYEPNPCNHAFAVLEIVKTSWLRFSIKLIGSPLCYALNPCNLQGIRHHSTQTPVYIIVITCDRTTKIIWRGQREKRGSVNAEVCCSFPTEATKERKYWRNGWVLPHFLTRGDTSWTRRSLKGCKLDWLVRVIILQLPIMEASEPALNRKHSNEVPKVPIKLVVLHISDKSAVFGCSV